LPIAAGSIAATTITIAAGPSQMPPYLHDFPARARMADTSPKTLWNASSRFGWRRCPGGFAVLMRLKPIFFQIQADALQERRNGIPLGSRAACHSPMDHEFDGNSARPESPVSLDGVAEPVNGAAADPTRDMPSTRFADNQARPLTHAFLRLANLDSGVFERLSRYQAALLRQTVQSVFILLSAKRR